MSGCYTQGHPDLHQEPRMLSLFIRDDIMGKTARVEVSGDENMANLLSLVMTRAILQA